MKANELKIPFIADYLKIDDIDERDQEEITMFLDAAKDYVMNQTGMDEDELNQHDDLTNAILVLVEDLYDNRRYYVDNQNVNKVVESIIGQYSGNLL